MSKIDSHYVSPLSGLFVPGIYPNIIELILSYITNFKDRRQLAKVSKHFRKHVNDPRSNGLRSLSIGPRSDRGSPFKATDHQFFTSSPIYLNDIAVVDPSKKDLLERHMDQLVGFFENLFARVEPLDTLVIVFNKLKYPQLDPTQIQDIFKERVCSNKETQKLYRSYYAIYKEVLQSATEQIVPPAIAALHDRNLYDDRVFACLLVALYKIRKLGSRPIAKSLYIRMDTTTINVRVFNARVYSLLGLLPDLERLTLDYAPPLLDAVPPKLEDFQNLRAIEIKLLQRRTLTDIANGEENQARDKFKTWLETTFKNMSNLKKFALRVLPHMALGPATGGFSHVMMNHWQNMDDVITMNDFLLNCPSTLNDLHFQTKATLNYIITQMLEPQHMRILKSLERLVVLTPSDHQAENDNDLGYDSAMKLLSKDGAPNLRQLIWITMRPIVKEHCQSLIMNFIAILKKQNNTTASMQPMLGIRFSKLFEVAQWLQKNKKIQHYRIISQSHVVLYFRIENNMIAFLHLQHAILDKSLKRRNVQSLAQLHGLKRPRYANSVHDQFGVQIY